MIYCISDIHGALKEFINLLKQIKFDPVKDELYLLGDYVDFNEFSIETLLYVKDLDEKYKNVHVTVGNHDLSFLAAVTTGIGFNRYYNGGGKVTIDGFNKLDNESQIKLLDYVKNLPYKFELDLNGRHFYLTHAAPIRSDNPYEDIWYRRELGEKHFEDDTILVCGHTPTGALKEFEDFFEVIFDGNTIMIDCFAKGFAKGLDYEESRLAALRLDDFKVFYQKKSY